MANESSVLVRLRLLGGARFAAESKTAAKGLGSIGTSAKAVESRMGGFNRKMAAAAGVVKRVGAGAALAAGTGIAYGIKQSVNFEQAMANVQARLLTTGGNMDKLKAQALDLGAKTQFSAGQAADAMGVLAQQGFSTNQIMSVLPGTLSLAAAAGTDLATAAEIQTNTLHGFGLAAKDAGRVADVLAQIANKSAADIDDMQESLKYIAPVAKATGQSLQDTGAAIGLMANVGIKGSQAGTTLRTAMVRLTNPTEKAQGALGDLGIKVGDLRGPKGLKPLPQIIGKVVSGAQGMSKSSRNAAIATLFGREALSGMISLVEAGPGKFNAMSKSLDNSKGAAKRSADIMRGTVKGAWDNFTGSVETAAITLLQKFQPAMKHALDFGADWVNRGAKAAGDFVKGLSGAIQPTTLQKSLRRPGMAMEGPRVQAAKGAGGAGARLRETLAPAFDWVKKEAPKVGKALLDAGKQLIDAFKPAMPFIQNVLLPLLKGIGIGVLGSVVGAFKVLIPIIKIVATVFGFVGKLLAPFKGIIEGIGVVIGFVAAGPILKFLSGLKYIGVVARVALVPIRIANAVFGFMFGVVARLAGAFVRVVTAVGRFGGTLSGVARKAITTVTNFVGGIISKIEGLIGKIRGLGGRFLSAGKSVGGSVLRGIRAGITSAAGFVGDIGRSIAKWLNDNTPFGDKVKVGPVSFTIPSLQTGGVVRSPLTMVGERGPELAALPYGSRVLSARDTRAAMRGSQPMDTAGALYVTANLHLSGQQIHSEVFKVDRAQLERS